MRTSEPKCLVVGGGFVGGHVARCLADGGARVTVFSRSLNPWLAEQAQGIDFEAGTIETEAAVLDGLVDDADVVLHFASSSKAPGAVAAPAVDVVRSIAPSVLLMESVARAGAGKLLVLASSGGTIYGPPEIMPTPESHPLRPETPYAIANVAIEQYSEYFERRYGIGRIVVRFANVYGPGELGRGGQGVIGSWLAAAACGERARLAASLAVARDYVFADDAARAVRLLVERRTSGVYNVGSSSSTSLESLLGCVAAQVGEPLELEIDDSQHVTAHVPCTKLDCTRLRRETGWMPQVDLPEGVAATWQWTRSYLARRPTVAASAMG